MANTSVSTHEVVLNDYAATPSYLRLGTVHSYGIEKIHVTPENGWDGLQILAVFHAPSGAAIKVVADEDGSVTVPAEATAARSGNGKIVFAGLAENVQRVTTDVGYTLAKNAGVNGDNPGTPTPDLLQQVLTLSKDAQAAAKSAKESAANAVKDATDTVKPYKEEAAQAAAGAALSAKGAAESKTAAQAAANAAAQYAKDATVVLDMVQDAGTEALSGIGSAKQSALTDIASAKDDAVSGINSAGATQTEKVENAGTEALKALDTAKTSAISAVGTAGTKAEQDIGSAKETALAAISGAQGQATQSIQQAGTTEVGKVNDAGAAQAKAVQDEGERQKQAVNEAGDSKLQQIEEANAILPTPTVDDAGKAPIVQSDGTYALQEVTVDAYTKVESDARYAPLEAAIKVSGKGTGLVSLSPTVGWGMQGMTMYGRSWQDGTPSVEAEVPIQSAGDSGTVDVAVAVANIFDAATAIAYRNIQRTSKSDVCTISEKSQIVLTKTGYLAWLSPNFAPGTYTITFLANKKFYSIQTNSVESVSVIKEYEVQIVPSEVLSVTITESVPFFISIRPGAFEPPLEISDFMVCPGKTAPNAFVPYVTPQQLPIPTPDGLPGIPVTSGGNWTDENGQQWVSDVIDFGALGKIQYCGQIASYAGEEITTPYISSTGALTTGAQVVYVLPEPVTTTLTAEEIAAYKALQSYPGTTNILAPDCGIEAAAVAEPAQYIENRIQAAATQAVSQAVTLTGGNT